jgi:NAD(P)-dependent dehydrogenase (short-subunit alcohol dehydrogenase family)
MPVQKKFTQQVALVTGAASGIGLATALRFGEEGAKLVLVDRDEARLREVEKKIQQKDMPAQISVCDVSSPDQISRSVQKALQSFGRLDVVVNNAGLMIFKPLQEHTAEDWQKVLAVDLMGTFYFIKEAFLHMKNGGAIVNVSSIHAVETTPMVASYAAAKAAVLSLTRTAAIEGKPKGIRVNAVLPGAINTPMLWENPNIKSGLEVIQKEDVGEADDVASAIVYLASPEARFVQGASLRVDGGRLAKL